MNDYLLQLKEDFGKKGGSWALWDKNGGIEIENIIKDISLIKPKIIFMGLNASREISKYGYWANFHFQKTSRKSWKGEPCRNLADVLSKPDFSYFSGAYMTDVIKTKFDPKSGDLGEAIKKDKSIIPENEELLKREMELLSKISGSDKLTIICMGDKSYNYLKQMSKIPNHEVHTIRHYASWGTREDIKGKIREKLRGIMNSLILSDS